MALLAGVWSVHDVDDVEKLLRRAINRSGHASRLRPHETDDLLSFLFEVAWRESLRFDAGRGSVSFGTLLFTTAQRRIIDFYRKEHGRTRWQFRDHTYERERPQLISFDEAYRGGLVEALTTVEGDREADLDPAFAGLLRDRDRHRPADLAELGLAQPEVAARRPGR